MLVLFVSVLTTLFCTKVERMSELNTYLSGMYREAQLTVLEQALELIADVGDSNSKSIATESLSIYKTLCSDSVSWAASPVRAHKVKRVRKTKAKAKAKAKAKGVKKAVKVVQAPTNGAAPTGDADSSQRLKEFRERESLSQKNAAAKAKVSISSWQAWESGKWTPGTEMMRRLAKVGV